MTADTLLSKLAGVRRTGDRRWLAQCPAHEDRTASLSIRELDDGRVLIHDFAGCGSDAVLAAIGLGMADLFPDRVSFGGDHRRGTAPHVPAADILRAIAHETRVAAVAASDLASGVVLTPEDHQRLCVAAHRLDAAVEVCRGR